MKLSVIIPVYNEKATIRELLEKVKAVDIDKELIIIDDGSTDGTREILQEEKDKGRKVFFHQKNIGKGAALRTGLQKASGDLVIIQDADLEYDPQDYKRLIQPLIEGKAEVVYGSRFGGEQKGMLSLHWLGNKLLTLLTNLLYRSNITDMETCYKTWKAEVIKNIPIKSDQFNFEAEITAKVRKRGIQIHEVPISYLGRKSHQGKKIKWIDGFSAVWALIKYRFME
ncbi:MAG: glycosyltransferase family 2 protein [Deltaproteobacteria bacterium]|nr:MAG: glycosyltransferase family 2 protein [Deltaproteobacteria bacterium]